MRKLIFIVFILFLNFSFSQRRTKEERKADKAERQALLDAKKNGKIDTGYIKDLPCNVTKKYDDFDEDTTYRTKDTYLKTGSYDNLRLSIIKHVKKDDSYSFLFIFRLPSAVRECVTSNSYVNIIFTDGEKLKINSYFTKTNCGANSVCVDATDFIQMFSEKTIDKARINLEYNHDYKLDERGQGKLKKSIECVLSI